MCSHTYVTYKSEDFINLNTFEKALYINISMTVSNSSHEYLITYPCDQKKFSESVSQYILQVIIIICINPLPSKEIVNVLSTLLG